MNKNDVQIFNSDSILLVDGYEDGVLFSIRVWDPEMPVDKIVTRDEHGRRVAYVNDELWFEYHGKIEDVFDTSKPGIYVDSSVAANDNPYIVVPPRNEEEYAIHTWRDKLPVPLDATEIIKQAQDATRFVVVHDASNAFIPELSDEDDILKRLIKLALREKSIDLDAYRHRFGDKNSLFNFKGLIKKTGAKMSIMLFDRGCSALNLRYTIIIEDADSENVIGTPLQGPITLQSVIGGGPTSLIRAASIEEMNPYEVVGRPLEKPLEIVAQTTAT